MEKPMEVTQSSNDRSYNTKTKLKYTHGTSCSVAGSCSLRLGGLVSDNDPNNFLVYEETEGKDENAFKLIRHPYLGVVNFKQCQ